MAAIGEVMTYLDELLTPAAFDDLGPNGLQVPGRQEVRRVMTGVTAQRALAERAVAEDADLVLVHHGLFWRGDPQQVTPLLRRRLKPLLCNDVALAAYHLPLDAHLEHGNNALLAAALHASDVRRFADYGVQVTFPEPLTVTQLVARVRDAVGGREPLVVDAGPQEIRTLGIVSGAASDDVLTAIDGGLDAFLTGEPAERAYSIATDAGIHFLAAGHHATETFGVRRLGELLATRFGVRHVYVDVPNPI